MTFDDMAKSFCTYDIEKLAHCMGVELYVQSKETVTAIWKALDELMLYVHNEYNGIYISKA